MLIRPPFHLAYGVMDLRLTSVRGRNSESTRHDFIYEFPELLGNTYTAHVYTLAGVLIERAQIKNATSGIREKKPKEGFYDVAVTLRQFDVC